MSRIGEPCPRCGNGTLEWHGRGRDENKSEGEFGSYTGITCNDPDCDYEGRDLVKGKNEQRNISENSNEN